MIDYVKSAFQNLGRKRVRTVLTILGIAIGVASVVIIGNISQCGTNALSNELESLGLSGLTISSSSDTAAPVSLNEDDLSIIKRCEEVEQAAPVMVESTDISARKLSSKALVWGIDTNASQIISINLLYGRLFNSEDISTGSNVCLVDEAFSKSTYMRSNIIGKTVSIMSGGVEENYKVIGIIKTGSGLLQNIIGNYIPTFVYVPYTTIQATSGRNDFDQIVVKVKSGGNVESIGKTIVDTLNRDNGTADAFVSNNLAKQKDSLTNMLGIITLILSAVGSVSLLVASLSIMTVMLVSVNERTREIGIKKAIGAKQSSIMLEFMFEAVLISLIGCVCGIAAGYVISFAGAEYFGVELSTRADIMMIAVEFSLASGTVFGVYPAYKASRLKPVDALRQE
ncbi:ABC transporter permease [Clostridium sp. KNHs216]|uniref:ABC transporter permease n=1 Tax=Clostridium sp. KNHs216 TaxID=1550235 RepID=UPI00114E952A|nr:ABC transporter permease [Clostridium sp. KNHs216]MBE6830693.1 FtsX-like permease family protein [Oscillospiraceae bacterium]TQI65727.1 putative ABC transport system permease protein [Clostridium sp. KNHs216]